MKLTWLSFGFILFITCIFECRSVAFSEKIPTARVTQLLNSKEVVAVTTGRSFRSGQRLILQSQENNIGVIAFFEIVEVASTSTDEVSLKAKLLTSSGKNLIRVGDRLVAVDFSSESETYNAKTDLLNPPIGNANISSRYKSIYTQGLGIGDTAETLTQDELLLTWYGLFAYGVNDWFSMSSYLPLNAFGGPNLQFKTRFFNSPENKLAVGMSLWKVPGSTESTFNFNFMWDSISSSSIISHSFVTLAVLSYDNSADATAIKSLGSSAIQSGYEFLLPNWSRVLVGPSYNFETKALGGYVSYLKIWDHLHLQVSLASNNLSSFKTDIKNGYYGFFDAYWRY